MTARRPAVTDRSAPVHLPTSEAAIWTEIMSGLPHVRPSAELEAFVGQVARMREAQRRIAAEGLIIADPKGYPIPHPAIEIEKRAQIEIRAWGGRFS
jgi:phage terminase small subunit